MALKSVPERSISTRSERVIHLSPDEAVIIKSLFSHGSQSRTDFTRKTRFSRSKVTDLVNDLLNKGILQEIDRPGHEKGKWKILNINPGQGYLVGIDIGTTSVDVGIADFSCKLINQQSEITHVNDGPEIVLSTALHLLKELLLEQNINGQHILGIGVGVPGPVSYPSGKVLGGRFTPGWEGFEIQKFFSRYFPGAVIIVDNDANLMAIGSHKSGAAQHESDFLFLKVGTGIGSGVYCRGHIHRGAASSAGHIGHTCVDFNGPVCRCGNRGCLEVLAGGPAIAQAAKVAAIAGESEILMQLMHENDGILTSAEVGEAAARHDRASLKIIVNSATLIGRVLSGAINLLNPTLIVIGGGVSKIGDLFLAEIRREVLKRSYSYATMGLRIEFSSIVDDVGVIGAFHLVRGWVFTVHGMNISAAL